MTRETLHDSHSTLAWVTGAALVAACVIGSAASVAWARATVVVHDGGVVVRGMWRGWYLPYAAIDAAEMWSLSGSAGSEFRPVLPAGNQRVSLVAVQGFQHRLGWAYGKLWEFMAELEIRSERLTEDANAALALSSPSLVPLHAGPLPHPPPVAVRWLPSRAGCDGGSHSTERWE